MIVPVAKTIIPTTTPAIMPTFDPPLPPSLDVSPLSTVMSGLVMNVITIIRS